jgi:hypothetical protein
MCAAVSLNHFIEFTKLGVGSGCENLRAPGYMADGNFLDPRNGLEFTFDE